MTQWDDFLDPSTPDTLITRGNRIDHLPHDTEALEMMWAAMEAAAERVWVTMFTLGDDPVGRGTLDRLAEAARRGCDVRLVYDFAGSLRLPDRRVEPIRKAGGHAIVFNRFWPPWKWTGGPGIRDHRKIIIADETAFCGGMNLGAEYAAVRKQRDGEVKFDDTSVRVRGPAVTDLAGVIQHTWDVVTGEVLPIPPRPRGNPDGLTVEVLPTDPRQPETRLIQVLSSAISRAERSCQITTPYFVPNRWLMDALKQARSNGANVKVVTAGRTDANVAQWAARHCYGELLEAGVRIYEMGGRIIHTKKLTVDSAFCAVGSYNFDIWTSRHVLDASIATVSEPLARSFEEEFQEDLGYSKEKTLDDWRGRGPLKKAASWLALQATSRL